MYQSETRIACGGDVYSQNQDEMGNLYREPSIVASYQVRLLWQSDFKGEDFSEIDQLETIKIAHFVLIL
jgi:hypothetical protein